MEEPAQESGKPQRTLLSAIERSQLAEIESIYASAPVGLCVLDTELRYIRLNQRYAEANGIPIEEHIGKTPGEIVPELARVETELREVLEKGEPRLNIEISRNAPARPGELQYWKENWVPIKDAAGKIIGISVAAEEITERRKAEAARNESEAKIRSIFQGSPIGMGILYNRVFMEVNARFIEISGYSREELIGRNARMVYPTEEEYEGVGREKRRQIAERGFGFTETRLRRKDGRVIDVLVSSTPFDPIDPSGGATFTVIDITERKKTEDALCESEQRYRSLFHDNHAVMLLIDPTDGKIIDANKAACEYYAYTPDEITRLKITDINILTPDQILSEMQLAKSAGRRHFFFKHRLGDGRIRDVEVFSGPIFIYGREILYSIVHDITERKKAEEALFESEKRYRALVITSSEFLYRMSPDWSEMRRLRSRGLLINTERSDRNWREKYIYADDLPHMNAGIEDAVRRKGIFKSEHRVKRADGSMGWVFSRAVPLLDANGEIVEWFGAVSDITERKLAEEALLEINETLEQQVAERTAIAESRAKQLHGLAVDLIEAEECERERIAGILHDDLQQLMASARLQVQAASRMADAGPILENVDQLLGVSIEKARHLSHELSPPVLHQFGLAAGLEWLVRHMDAQFGLRVHLEAEMPQKCKDRSLRLFLFRAVQELLFNSIKYSGVKNADVHLKGSENRITLSVWDHGKGFNPDALDSFDIKAGLGLVSLRERAKAIGGELAIKSAPGQGSRFILTVPISLAELNEPQELTRVVEQQALQCEKRMDVSGSEIIRVMFADDHKVLRQGLVGLVSSKPDIVVVGEAANGEEALDMARLFRPDVVVMDISMPKMDGVEATRRIKAEMPDVRVVGLSMFEDEDIARKMRRAGAEECLSKSGSSAELLKAIYKVAGKQIRDTAIY